MAATQAEILMIGTELLLGQIEDTNATHISQVLADNGINLYQKTTVGDNHDRICDALREALSRSDVVLCSGGLGPTEDDITRECVAEVMDRPLEYHEEIFELIESMFARYNLRLTENNKKQAMVPRDATMIENPNGTAPGLLVDDARGIIICMPGVPRELKAMLSDSVIPYLRDKFDLSDTIHYRVLKICGIGESHVDNTIGDLITDSKNPTVGVLANPLSVRIRIAAKAGDVAAADALIDPVDAEIRRRFPKLIMGVDEDTVEGVVNELLAERAWTLAVVETISGGMIGQRMTAVSASQFKGARVLPIETLDLRNTPRMARELAQQAQDEFSASCALAVLSDPEAGATTAVFIHPDGQEEWTFGRPGRSELMQARIATLSLEYIRRFLVGA